MQPEQRRPRPRSSQSSTRSQTSRTPPPASRTAVFRLPRPRPWTAPSARPASPSARSVSAWTPVASPSRSRAVCCFWVEHFIACSSSLSHPAAPETPRAPGEPVQARTELWVQDSDDQDPTPLHPPRRYFYSAGPPPPGTEAPSGAWRPGPSLRYPFPDEIGSGVGCPGSSTPYSIFQKARTRHGG